MALRATFIRQATTRPNLVMGGERDLVYFAGLMAFVLIFIGFEFKSFVSGIALWVFALYAFRLMAKSDPQLSKVLLRHIIYKKYYPARSTPFYNNTNTQKRQYR